MFCTAGNGWIADHLGVFGRGSPREHTFTNQTLAHVLTKDDEHLANLITASEARASPSCFVSSHGDHQ
jgi:hypothetical protein